MLKEKVLKKLLSVTLILAAVLFMFVSCDNGEEPGGSGGGAGGGGSIVASSTYNVTVMTKGGMAMADLPVYVFALEDGVLGEMIDGAYGATDKDGKVSFKLPDGRKYAVRIDLSIPEGYDAKEYYPLLESNTKIEVTSAVIPETSLTGVSYSLGDVIRDFTVNSTVLVKGDDNVLRLENQVFTLSEALKEKDAVLINFWYTTCSWCITEFPYMQKTYEKYSDDIAIIALDPLTDDTLVDIKNFQLDMGLTFNVGQDLFGLASSFGVTGYPTSVMVDKYGVITLIEPGAIPSERAFNLMFEHFSADNYVQKLIYDINDIVPKEKPNVDMPTSTEIGEVFDGSLLGDLNYRNDEDDEWSWPFIIGQIGEGSEAINVVYPANANRESSYAQLIFDVPLKAGEVLAFDYFSSSELGADILYVIVDGKDIYSISGESDKWATCYAFVAEEDATYNVGLVYTKDSSDDIGDDTVYLKSLRIVSEEDIDSATYIYRFAATKPNFYGEYEDYITPVYNEKDGYFHVNSADGPILLADLMGYTRFSDSDYVYNMSIGKSYQTVLVQYCNYASNSVLYGLCPVTEELKGLLIKVSEDYGDASNPNDWLRLCCYYDAYGTDGKQLEDPIRGLALFSAYDTILSEYGDTDFPNEIVYNRVIMPRGLIYKFTPEVSGTYLITSRAPDAANPGAFISTDAWIFVGNGFHDRAAWYTYESVDRNNETDFDNCYMMVYMEAGKDYYIDIAYYDVYQEGTISFRIERLGGEGHYRFTLASPGYFTYNETISGGMGNTISGGIAVEKIGNYWYEKRTDGVAGSLLYADFTKKTPIFSHSLAYMIDSGAFDFSRTENDQFVLNYLAMNDNDPVKCDAYLRALWGDTYAENREIYQLDDVYNGIYHGDGQDYTALARQYYENRIVAGYNAILEEDIAENDARIGCVIVTDELANLLQKIMDKYTFEGVENSWAKVCYYMQYFCAETPY